MPCAIWPTLMQLENAMLGDYPEHLHILRHQLDWTPKMLADISSEPVDPTYDRIRVMIENFGPKCLNCVDSEGNTLVHQAAFESADEKAVELIMKVVSKENQSHFYRQGKGGYTVFEIAAQNPCNGALKYLVKTLGTKGVKQTSEYESGIVCLSAYCQGADTMKFFMNELGASCFHKLFGPCQRNAFHYAAMNSNSNEALAWLIKEIGIAPLKVKDALGNMPVHLAAWMQGEESMQLIYEHMGDPMFDLLGQDRECIVHSAAQNKTSNTALLWCMKVLPRHTLLLKDLRDRMPIHHAAALQDEEVLKLAVELDDECLLTPGENGMTVVHYAAMNTKTLSPLRWVVERLGYDCLIKLRDVDGRMPIHVAASHQGLESLIFVMQNVGLTAFDLVSGNGRTIAHYAAENVHKAELMQWISVRAAQSLHVKDINGETPAVLASR